ncbi:MAG: NAD(P)/FAD-dependent oxidoreductase [Actinobacteria bacterium]|nr:NAD(P)/FAD-dependent oxidoreductase [Actinomycetota bacterium]MBU1943208.1 NAD(P)/FAD-dependent oxidoreductase [Actinomycetota bacterium]MBU2686233.1 NAD(P)/FAD-dependent oxidoreductase [Actinomycetota bacterium]
MGIDSIIIIGAGVAGLSAGCYARMNGYDTTIFEMHDKPGGVCTSWTREGYTFDGCIHWLVGSRPDSEYNRIWRELGALQGRTIVDHEEFCRVEGEGGKALVIYTDADRLGAHLKQLSPRDSALFDRMVCDIKALTAMPAAPENPPELRRPLDGLKMLPGMLPLAGPFMRWRGKSIQEFGAGLSDEFLRDAFPRVFEVPDFPMLAALMTFAWMHARDAGYPVGGSLEFSRAIERRYLDLGRAVSYKSRVEKILAEGGRAVGVMLADGSEHRADVVVSAADGHSTIFDMLDGRFTDPEIRGYYATFPLFPAIMQVSLGVDADFSDEPHMVNFPLKKPFLAAGKAYDRIAIQHYCYDPTMAPEGKSALVVYLESDFDYWKALRKDRKRYKAEKEEVAAAVIAAIASRHRGFAGKVEVVDVATPATYERYTGNWRGSFEGFLITTRTSKYMLKGMKRELPGLERFYMIGQWLSPGGGLPPAAQHGREIIQLICTRDGRTFTTSEA